MVSLPPLTRRFSSEFHAVQEGFRNCNIRKSIGGLSANERTKLNRRIYLSRDFDHGRKAECFHRNEGPEMINGCEETLGSKVNPLSTSLGEVLHPVLYASESNSIGNHHRSLQTYLEKLQCQSKQLPSNSETDSMECDDESNQARKELGALERYLSTLEQGAKLETSTSGGNMSVVTGDFANSGSEIDETKQHKGFAGPRYKRSNIKTRKSASGPLYDEKDSGYLYLIGLLLAINIAVFLFEIASPIKSSDYNLYSLPLMYGAKVNDLIMVGEWWRLVTPMFLHSGPFDIALCSSVLLSFGPQVCKRYGSFTFLLIYILGGIFGNFSSFLHTSEPTVGGSGPVFAVIGAWLVYQVQNKEVTEKDLSETMYKKAVIATALSFVLGIFWPVDNWTNLGAAISGIVYGYFTCPVLQVDDASSDGTQKRVKEEIMLIKKPVNPCKSLVIFTIFLSVLSSMLFFVESPLENLDLEELLQIIE